MQEKQQLPTIPPGYSYEPDLEHICRIAAWVGKSGRDDAPLSFTSLLIGFLSADDSVSNWFKKYCEKANIKTADIRATKLGSGEATQSKKLEEALKSAESGGLPVAEPLYSGSAEAMLNAAKDFLPGSDAENKTLAARHLMAAYAYATPQYHQAQISGWGFTLPNWQQALARFLIRRWFEEKHWAERLDTSQKKAQAESSEAISSADESTREFGHDQEEGSADAVTRFLQERNITTSELTREILKLAAYFANYGDHASRKITTSRLLFAMVEIGQRCKPTDHGAEALILLANLIKEQAGDQYTAVMNDYFEGIPHIPESEELSDVPAESMSENTQRWLRQAVDLGRNYFDVKDIVGAAGLVAALLIAPKGNVLNRLREMKVDLEALCQQYLVQISHEHPEQKINWQRLMRGDGELPLTPEIISAHYMVDSPDADDLIGVEDEARSFARYVTKSNLSTPLAIGLFGDWGSGKTFFMRKMQKFVNELQEHGKTDRELRVKSSWCENVVQIEFNAWHYIESNLWASLVEHIFSEMDAWLTREKKASIIDDLYKVFESAQEVKREAEAELQEAEGAHKDAKNALKCAMIEYEEAVKKHRTLCARDIWSVINNLFTEQQKNNPELKKSIENASKNLGIEELRVSAKKLHEVVTQAGDVAGRSRLLLSSLFSRKRNDWQYGVLVGSLALAPLAMGLVWMWANSCLQVDGMLQSISAGVVELSALMTVIVGWGAVGLRSANNALALLEKADGELKDTIDKESKEQREALAIAESEVATTEERASLAEQRVSQAVNMVDKARQRLEAETPRARLSRFLRRRLENADYAKHLGVVSMIRKDFELLSRIMTGEDWTEADREKLEKVGVELEKARAFERIILYVDDLDRCPADRVVEVLQAVHLLLTFPLFVVVVGVDARWVSRALSLGYQHLLSETVARDIERAPNQDVNQDDESNIKENGNHGRESLRVSELIASSHDYLEKIFQVPYWVKPMDKDSSEDFIEKLARLSLQESKKIEPRTLEFSQEGLLDSELEQANKIQVTDRVAVQEEKPEEKGLEKEPAEVKNEVDDVKFNNGEFKKESSYTTELAMVELPLSEYEIEFMKTLAPNIGRSPRRSKRFFNVYQLVRAGLSVEERRVFVGDDGKSLDYKVLMCLLAIVTGAPILAPQFFAEVVDWDEQGKVSLIALIKRISKYETFSKSSEWARLSGTLDVLHGIGQNTKTFERMRYWTRRAMRFSFTARPI